MNYPYSTPGVAGAPHVSRRQQLAQAVVKMADKMDESSYRAGRATRELGERAAFSLAAHAAQSDFGKFQRASIRQRLALLRLINALAAL